MIPYVLTASEDEETVARGVADVGTLQVAHVYGEALLNAAEQAGQVDEVLADFEAIAESIAEPRSDLRQFFASGVIGRDTRADILRKVLRGPGQPAAREFPAGRQRARPHRPCSPPCSSRLRQLRDQRTNRLPVTVYAAVPLPTTSSNASAQPVRDRLQLEPMSRSRSIPDLLGGIVFRVGDWVFDGTVRTRWTNCATNSSREAVMRFKADEIVSVLQTEIEQYRAKLDAREVGRVLEVGDGIARVYGLSGVMAGEMVEFTRTGVRGLAFNLEENSVGVIILGDYLEIDEGDEVRTTGELLRVPVGDALIGRVVDPLGNPLDGKGPIVTDADAGRSNPSPPASPAGSRSNQPLQTGIKAIDAMTPIGRGQRELIIGDRKTGKTAIAIDTIINQKEENVICVYVAIGQKESTVAQRRREPARARRDGLHDRRRRLGVRPGPAAVLSPPTPAAPWPSTSCTSRAATRCASTTT